LKPDFESNAAAGLLMSALDDDAVNQESALNTSLICCSAACFTTTYQFSHLLFCFSSISKKLNKSRGACLI
jgi:hypothetical protein